MAITAPPGGLPAALVEAPRRAGIPARACNGLAVSYLRYSTLAQMAGDSEARQARNAQRFCEEAGLRLAADYRDRGVAAYRNKHATMGHLGAFIRDVRGGRILKGTVLILEALHRLSRDDVVDAVGLLLDILREDILVVVLIDKLWLWRRSPAGTVFTAVAMLAGAGAENRNKADRVRESWEARRQRIGNVHPGWLEPDWKVKAWRAVSKRVKLLYEIFRDADAGLPPAHRDSPQPRPRPVPVLVAARAAHARLARELHPQAPVRPLGARGGAAPLLRRARRQRPRRAAPETVPAGDRPGPVRPGAGAPGGGHRAGAARPAPKARMPCESVPTTPARLW